MSNVIQLKKKTATAVSQIRKREDAAAILLPKIIGLIWDIGGNKSTKGFEPVSQMAEVDLESTSIHLARMSNGGFMLSVYGSSNTEKFTKVFSAHVGEAHLFDDRFKRIWEGRCGVLSWKRGPWEDAIASTDSEPRTLAHLLTAGLVRPSSEAFTRDNNEVLLERRAPIATSSWNADARTLEVVFSTGAGVQRMDMRGAFTETLALAGFSGGEGVPFLDHHRQDSFDSILGSVISTQVVGNEARAVIRLSKTNPMALRLAEELTDGQRFGVSVGYNVDEWKERNEGGQRVKEAVKWTIGEISLVSVPADRGAGTRGHDGGDNRSGETANRAEANASIRSMARPLGLSQSWIDGQIDRGASLDDARQAAMNELIRRGNAGNLPNQRVSFGEDFTAPAHLRTTFGEAIYCRLNPTHRPSAAAQPFVRHTLGEIAEEVARIRGIGRDGQSRTQFLIRMMTTSDFAAILQDSGQRVMLDAHRVLGSALKGLGRQVRATDFRPLNALQLSEGQILEKVNEQGEVKAGKFIDTKESFSVEKHALRFGLTDRVIVNDDVGMLDQMGRRFGQIAAATEAEILVKLLEANAGGGPKMSDGKTVFHADHGNLAAPGTTPWLTATDDIAAIGAIRTAMRRQTGLQGQPIAVTPKFLVVPPEGETWGEKVLSDIAAATVGDANPFASKLQLVVEPRLTDTKGWYVVADPNEATSLEWAYLEGMEGPQIESRAGWEVEGVEFKIKIAFGAGFVDHRGWYRNPGQA